MPRYTNTTAYGKLEFSWDFLLFFFFSLFRGSLLIWDCPLASADMEELGPFLHIYTHIALGA